MMYYYNDFMPVNMFGFGSIVMVLFWVFVIYGIFSLFKHTTQAHKNTTNSTHALNILKERYVKGEITKEQFEVMKKDIE